MNLPLQVIPGEKIGPLNHPTYLKRESLITEKISNGQDRPRMKKNTPEVIQEKAEDSLDNPNRAQSL